MERTRGAATCSLLSTTLLLQYHSNITCTVSSLWPFDAWDSIHIVGTVYLVTPLTYTACMHAWRHRPRMHYDALGQVSRAFTGPASSFKVQTSDPLVRVGCVGKHAKGLGASAFRAWSCVVRYNTIALRVLYPIRSVSVTRHPPSLAPSPCTSTSTSWWAADHCLVNTYSALGAPIAAPGELNVIHDPRGQVRCSMTPCMPCPISADVFMAWVCPQQSSSVHHVCRGDGARGPAGGGAAHAVVHEQCCGRGREHQHLW